MKRIAILTLFIVACASLAAHADLPKTSARVPAPTHLARSVRHHPAVTPTTPTPTPPPPVEKKHSWLYRLFHPARKPKPTPVIASPTPQATPVKKIRKRPRAAAKPAPTISGEPGGQPTPAPIPKRSRTKPDNLEPANGLMQPAPFVPDTTSSAGSGRPERSTAQDAAHFKELKTRALEDKHVQELQAKSDNAPEGDEQRKASEEYYHALFNKMRELDPSLKDRIDRTEAATLRRL